MLLFFETWIADVENSKLLTEKQQPNRLITFSSIKAHEETEEDFHLYVQTGQKQNK